MDAANAGKQARIYYVSPLGGTLAGIQYATDINTAKAAIAYLPDIKSTLPQNAYMLSIAMKYTYEELLPLMIDSDEKYCFIIDAFSEPSVTTKNEYITNLVDNDVKVFFEYNKNNDNLAYYESLSKGNTSEITIQKGRYNFGDFILSQLNMQSVKYKYPIVSPITWQYIELNAPITIGYKTAAEDVIINPQNIERYRQSGMADTDGDGLLDFQEINFELFNNNGDFIGFDENGNLNKLPTVVECTDIYVSTYGTDNEKPLTYFTSGFNRLKRTVLWDDIIELHMLPLKSLPTDPDGDEDGYNDKVDRMPLIWEISSISLKNINYVGYDYNDRNQVKHSYGGDQGWFLDDILIYGPYLAKIGCGLVASCDTIEYLKQQQSVSIPKTRTDFSGFAQNYFVDYITLYDINQDELELFRNRFEIGGLWPEHLCDSIQKYLEDENIMNTNFFLYFDFTDKDTFSRDIFDMLSADIPVIVRIGLNNVTTESNDLINWHYVVITGMDVDYENSVTVLTFSSWGSTYKINLDELYDVSELQFTGGYVYFENQN